jgi:hypothetical protein
MKKFIFLAIVAVLFSGAWWLGQPGNPPAPTQSVGLPVPDKGIVKGANSDQVAPISSLKNIPKLAGKGTILNGSDYDLGSGVVSVVYQIQRNSDGAVWNGQKWQENIGSVLDATLSNQDFTITIPVNLVQDQKYVIRTQAIDAAGNAQTKWSEYTLIGQDAGTQTQSL